MKLSDIKQGQVYRKRFGADEAEQTTVEILGTERVQNPRGSLVPYKTLITYKFLTYESCPELVGKHGSADLQAFSSTWRQLC